MGAPGKAYRNGISLVEAAQTFGDDEKAEAWFVSRRWPNGIQCVTCEGKDIHTRKPSAQRKTPLYHCNTCKKDFTVKTGTIMHDSRLPLHKWALAFYLFSTNLKGVSSMKLHRDLGITQKSAWHMAHRIRKTWDTGTRRFAGPVEVDETAIGGLEKNKHANKRQRRGRGTVGKEIVAGALDRETNMVSASVVDGTDRLTLQTFVARRIDRGATLYTDEHAAYKGLPNHQAVNHSAGHYVDGMAHTNGVESFWAQLKRGYHGTFHHFSAKHLQRYVNEFAGRHNARPLDTADQMAKMVRGATGKRLPYATLIGQA